MPITGPAHASALVFLLSLTTAMPAMAEDAPPLLLETITLTPMGDPDDILTNPASVSVIGREEIRKIAPVSVASLLRDVPGVRVDEEGIERISIRGESSRRVAILIDGQKLTDHSNYGTPVLIDPASIERIEVIRGSASVTAGTQAIGGAVNIITKKGAGKPFELTTTAGVMSATEGWRASASAAGTRAAGEGELDYRLTLNRMDQGDRQTPDGILENSDTQDSTLSAHLGYRIGDHYFGAKSIGYDLSANVYSGDDLFLIELPKRDLRKHSLFYEGTGLTPWLTRLSFDIYRQTVDRAFNNDITQFPGPMRLNVRSGSLDEQLTYGANLRAELQLSDRSRTVLGLEFEDDRLEADKTTVTTVTGPMLPFPSVTTRQRYDEASIRTFSVFGQHEIELDNNLTATLGGRWYKVTAKHDASREDGINLPREDNSDSLGLFSAGLVWSPDETLALRANVSQGYVYPSLSQLFLSTTAGGEGTILGNPDLAPERATTFELGARVQREALQLDATLFYSDAKDYIGRVVVNSSNPRNPISQYQNIDTAKTWGFEVHAQRDIEAWGLTPYVTATLMSREFTYANGYSTDDSGTAAFAGRAGLSKSWVMGNIDGTFDLFLRGESAVELRDDTGTVTKRAAGYGTLNLHTTADLNDSMALTFEVNNLTDRSYDPYLEMPGAERSVNLFLTKTF